LAPVARWSAFSLSIQSGCQCRVFLISQRPLLGQQSAGQPTFNLSSRLMTQVDAEAFKGSG
jgi:hypothetical protein